MDYQVSARKYRPGTFQDVIGQPHAVQTLMNAVQAKRVAHAFLFSGTRGVGKTTVARILAKALNCERGPTVTPCETCPSCVEITQGACVDVIEIDGASNTGVDDVREIRENVKFSPFRGSYRVYIIDEVHMLSNSAFNALLKTLEEPPSHVVFIFATTEIHKIPATILSRCQHYNFRRISRSDIVQRLRHVADQDGLVVEDRSLASIARASEGSMRDALSLLDQMVAFGGQTIRHADVEILLGSVPQELIQSTVAAIITQDSRAALRTVGRLLDQGYDLRAYSAAVLEYVRNLMVAAVVPSEESLHELIDLSNEDLQCVLTDAKKFTVDQLQELFRLFAQVEDGLRTSAHPRFLLEAAMVRATRLFGSEATTNASQESPTASPARSASSNTPPPPQGSPAPIKQEKKDPSSGPATVGTLPSRPTPVSTSSISDQAASGALSSTDSTRSCTALSAAQEIAPMQPPFSWEQVVERMEHLHPNIGPFLAMGSLMSIEGNQITVGYSKAASVARTRVQKEETLQHIANVCTELAGRPIGLRVVELTDDQKTGPSLAQMRSARAQTHKHTMLEQVRSHPLVKQTLEFFGADLTDVRETLSQEETR